MLCDYVFAGLFQCGLLNIGQRSAIMNRIIPQWNAERQQRISHLKSWSQCDASVQGFRMQYLHSGVVEHLCCMKVSHSFHRMKIFRIVQIANVV